ncbi:hypothetical protein BABINDRAFT_15493 [Babjeviella inositovora NRRL Y-12698]|uniref:SAC domain-containing protein n=1 Tax=Babjeviella inositovora NRRL Y-12698 TaxID=984486 RepID=A0A1E3QIJ0_9ASCO|nr:uncharacterized protein BABINDRAFT_15493 [Babjeviella inositovora NRRL Y-12698]ODQ77515.1 hypothetical protein BABINDRAFT_15493 [Babjeviella inositovora NRRL Y-12698]
MLFYSQSTDGTVYVKDTDASTLIVSSDAITVSKDADLGLQGTPAAALLGVLRLKLNKYVVLAETAEAVGSFNGASFFHARTFKVLNVTNRMDDEDELHFLHLLNLHLSKATLYFSDAYDLTNSLQRQHEKAAADSRFFWNRHMCQDIAFERFVTPFIYGYVKFVEAQIGGRRVSFGLVTRRSTMRAGTRYLRRGIDDEGNVGNFNETEQILLVDGKQYSYLQTRGSVPVFWCEVNNIKYRPNLFVNKEASLAPAKKHFQEQTQLYGKNYLVNLVDQEGYELPVKEAYEDVVALLGDARLQYIYFDFHHECRKMQWHRVKLLLEQLTALGYSNRDYFSSEGSKQTSVVRTNCMDCLDRTNVVQSMLARWILQEQLIETGVVDKTPWEIVSPAFNLVFQNMWADNADAVSFAYSGTGALKTDFTRTGSRTKIGALNDLSNSITRYYRNNLEDGERQDAFDIALGNFHAYESVVSPFADARPLFVQAVPSLIAASFIVTLASFFYPRGGAVFGGQNLVFLLGSVLVGLGLLQYVISHGSQYVQWPKLVPVNFLAKKPVSGGVEFVRGDTAKTPDDVKTTTIAPSATPVPRKAPIIVQANEPKDFRVTTSHISLLVKIDLIGCFGDLFVLLDDVHERLHTNPFLRDHEFLRSENRKYQRSPKTQRGVGTSLQGMARECTRRGYAKLDRTDPRFVVDFKEVDRRINEMFLMCVELDMGTRLDAVIELPDRFHAVNQTEFYKRMVETHGTQEIYRELAKAVSGINKSLLESSFAWREETNSFNEPQLRGVARDLARHLRHLQRYTRALAYLLASSEASLEDYLSPHEYIHAQLYLYPSSAVDDFLAVIDGGIVANVWPLAEFFFPKVEYFHKQLEANEFLPPLRDPELVVLLTEFREKSLDIYSAKVQYTQATKNRVSSRMTIRAVWLFFECLLDYVTGLAEFVSVFSTTYVEFLEGLTEEERAEYQYSDDVVVETCKYAAFMVDYDWILSVMRELRRTTIDSLGVQGVQGTLRNAYCDAWLAAKHLPVPVFDNLESMECDPRALLPRYSETTRGLFKYSAYLASEVKPPGCQDIRVE